MANSVYPDEVAHKEPPHQDVRCLQIPLFSSLVLKELIPSVQNKLHRQTVETPIRRRVLWFPISNCTAWVKVAAISMTLIKLNKPDTPQMMDGPIQFYKNRRIHQGINGFKKDAPPPYQNRLLNRNVQRFAYFSLLCLQNMKKERRNFARILFENSKHNACELLINTIALRNCTTCTREIHLSLLIREFSIYVTTMYASRVV